MGAVAGEVAAVIVEVVGVVAAAEAFATRSKVAIAIEEVSVVSVTKVGVAAVVVVVGQEEEEGVVVVDTTGKTGVVTMIEEVVGVAEEVTVIVMVEEEGVVAVVYATPFRRVTAREEVPVGSAIIKLSR